VLGAWWFFSFFLLQGLGSTPVFAVVDTNFLFSPQRQGIPKVCSGCQVQRIPVSNPWDKKPQQIFFPLVPFPRLWCPPRFFEPCLTMERYLGGGKSVGCLVPPSLLRFAIFNLFSFFFPPRFALFLIRNKQLFFLICSLFCLLGLFYTFPWKKWRLLLFFTFNGRGGLGPSHPPLFFFDHPMWLIFFNPGPHSWSKLTPAAPPHQKKAKELFLLSYTVCVPFFFQILLLICIV